MTRTETLPGASSASLSWDTIKWQTIKKQVLRLQLRIAKAVQESRWGKVKALQWLLTHSRIAKLLAVRRVVRNTGRNTAGVDGMLWKSGAEKLKAAESLQRRGYQAQPLRRLLFQRKMVSVVPGYSNTCGQSYAGVIPVRFGACSGDTGRSQFLWVSS